MAQARVLPEIAVLPFLRIAAAADLRRVARDAFESEFEAPTFGSVEELCKYDGIDAVYVATPHELHALHTICALECGKHVIVEKPMALSLDDAEAMNLAAERNGLTLVAGHTHSFDPPVRKMAELVAAGALGRPAMISSTYYKDHLFRPFSDHDIAMSRGVVLNQGPHQVDIVRQIGGGLVERVRARTGALEPSRPGEGHYSCFLDFAGELSATLTYSGYAYLDSAEMTWGLGEGGEVKDPQRHAAGRRLFRELPNGAARAAALEAVLERRRYGSAHPSPVREGRVQQPFFGLTIVTCEGGDIRQSPDGLFIYDDRGRHEIPLPRGVRAREAELLEFFAAIREDRPPAHDGRWGEATLEVCLAMLESSARREEVRLVHQVPMREFLITPSGAFAS